MTDQSGSAQIILVHPNGERQTFTHDPEDPLWWRDDRDLFNGWRRLAERIERFMERQTARVASDEGQVDPHLRGS